MTTVDHSCWPEPVLAADKRRTTAPCSTASSLFLYARRSVSAENHSEAQLAGLFVLGAIHDGPGGPRAVRIARKGRTGLCG
jgi:hypothetical protein